MAGADFCPEMLKAAAGKTSHVSDGGKIALLAADAQQLPFRADTFDCLVNGFLLRNLADLNGALREFHRVLKPGGRLACLDLTHPPLALRPLLWPWFRLAVPILGGLVSGDFDAYTYLPDSLQNYPDAPRLCAMMRTAGFTNATYRRVGAGTVAIHTAAKPQL